MANTTFLQIVNNVLIRLNEVPLDQYTFDSSTGVQSMVKIGITNAIDKINQTEGNWPFYAVEQTVNLVAGTQEYAWPANFNSVDWKSFQIQENEVLDNRSKFLSPIEREQWYRYYRDTDYDAKPDGLRMPEFVFSTHGNGFGLTPSPDKNYTMKYRYFKNPVRPVMWSDEIPTPKDFDYVIESGGLYQAYVFYDNDTRAQIIMADRDQGIKDMTRVLNGNNFEHVYSGQISTSGMVKGFNF